MRAPEATLARARAMHIAETRRGAWDALTAAEQREYIARAAAEGPAPTAPPPLARPGAELSDADRALLDLESRTYRYYGAKTRAMRSRLGMGPTAYLVRLNQLLDSPAALAYAPAVVNRLRARRTSARVDEDEGR